MAIKIWASRYHDFSAGHRVVGHENKCRFLHGHNYRVHFKCSAEQLDGVGRVIDFGVIKGLLCEWVEDNWDHRFLMWNEDPLCGSMGSCDYAQLDPTPIPSNDELIDESIVPLPFNPTAENMAEYLLRVIGPIQLEGTGVVLEEVMIEETRKCSAGASL